MGAHDVTSYSIFQHHTSCTFPISTRVSLFFLLLFTHTFLFYVSITLWILPFSFCALLKRQLEQNMALEESMLGLISGGLYCPPQDLIRSGQN